MSIAVFPGSFDPFTNGHLDVLLRSAPLFDKVYVTVLANSDKRNSFTPAERLEMLDAVIAARGMEERVVAAASEGLLTDFMRGVGATWVIRGVRNASDLEYEKMLEAVNKRLYPGLETLYLTSDPALCYISSTVVRELCKYERSIIGLVPEVIQNKIAERLNKR